MNVRLVRFTHVDDPYYYIQRTSDDLWFQLRNNTAVWTTNVADAAGYFTPGNARFAAASHGLVVVTLVDSSGRPLSE